MFHVVLWQKALGLESVMWVLGVSQCDWHTLVFTKNQTPSYKQQQLALGKPLPCSLWEKTCSSHMEVNFVKTLRREVLSFSYLDQLYIWQSNQPQLPPLPGLWLQTSHSDGLLWAWSKCSQVNRLCLHRGQPADLFSSHWSKAALSLLLPSGYSVTIEAGISSLSYNQSHLLQAQGSASTGKIYHFGL